MAINYATYSGIHSLAAPIVFAVLYSVCFLYFLAKAIARPNYVYIIMTFFCSIRITAFILRALLASVQADAESLNFYLAYAIIYNTGFFSLLYSVYSLVDERADLATNPPRGLISRLLRNHFLFRLALTAAVTLGITGSIESSLGSSQSTIDTGNTLREAAVYIFLVCAILVCIHTYFLARVEFSEGGYRSSNKLGSTYAIYILLVISALLVARESFFTATVKDTAKQNNEAYWYPFAVVTEFIAVVLFAAPGLVPHPSDA
ncbi:hypothetical protein HD554DRAFT_2016948 [Boletus coccyginus]|nr:hypothetical protein HD554DRAFT_2016948 [Boletus coccyginus]